MILMNPELVGDGDIEITRAQNRNYLLGEGFRRMVGKSTSWSLFVRYQAQAERHYRRAVDEFERLRRLRSKPRRPAARLRVQPEMSRPVRSVHVGASARLQRGHRPHGEMLSARPEPRAPRREPRAPR